MKRVLIPIFTSFFLSAYVYPTMPEVIATHWNVLGQADGYGPKAFGLFLFPVLITIMTVLLLVVPSADPLKKNVRTFWPTYTGFVTVMSCFLLYLQLLVIGWNRGMIFNFLQFLLPAFSVLLFTSGTLMEKSKRNWFIGIRTPWTLSNDKIWNKTHTLGAKLFKASAVLTFLAIFLPDYAFALFMTSILIAALLPVLYSYLLFRK